MDTGTEPTNQTTWATALAHGDTVQWRQRITWGWVLFGAITLALLVRMAGIALQGWVATGELLVITLFWLALIVFFMMSNPALLRRTSVRIGPSGIAVSEGPTLTWAQVRDVRVLRILGRKRVQLVLESGAMRPTATSWWRRLFRSADPRGRWVLLPDWLPVDPDEVGAWLAAEVKQRAPREPVVPPMNRPKQIIKRLKNRW